VPYRTQAASARPVAADADGLLRAAAILADMIPLLGVASCSFDAGADIRENAVRIREAIRDAAGQGAHCLLTPECALIGYPGQARESVEEIDWQAVARLEDELSEAALERHLALVLGTASPVAGGVTNDALVCGQVDHDRRYRKRVLTPLDRQQFMPGPNYESVTFPCQGWNLAVTICFEVRFPLIWLDLARRGADAFVHIAHMAGSDPDPGTKSQVIPAHYCSRAAELATPIVTCNTAAANRWCDSAYYDARGVRVASCAEGMMMVQVAPRETFDEFYRGIRDRALRLRRELRDSAEQIV